MFLPALSPPLSFLFPRRKPGSQDLTTHLKSITASHLDSLQFAYRANRPVDHAVNQALHFVLEHLDCPGTYARILFVDFSSVFNRILPALLEDKPRQLDVPDSLSRWMTDFLTSRSQRLQLGTTVSDTRTLNIGSPQGCVLSPWLFSLYTNCCTSSHKSVKLIKFADDTTIIGLISDGDESAYRREVERLVSWCSHNNLELNAQKTVEMVMDFRRVTVSLSPLMLAGLAIPIVDSFCFLGTTITEDLKWEPTIRSLIRKAQQRMFFLRQAKKTTTADEVAGGVLHGHHPVHAHLLYHRLVQQRHLQGQEPTAAHRPRDVQVGSEPSLLTLDMDCLFLFLWQEATVHPDQNLPSQEQFLPLGHQTVEFVISL
ncbi:uncharacterized protein LOC128759684 [Synchiropus splendidus]|uniref:uncharacterized protein LOC128759684 n=1 Tax=Synchiropus splendidus TaxID=270530 RepID=UPI00237DF30A|nr:uncharacterized protein LOC128759684 [Synchiropus splendidus]